MGVNYWGYSTLQLLRARSPLCVRSLAGGSTREFEAMVKAFQTTV